MSRLVHRDQQDRSFDLEFWEKVGAAGRFEAAWQMLKEVQLIRGQSGELPRMQRNVTRVLRRSQMKKEEEAESISAEAQRPPDAEASA
jgi:hypothetical protein